VVENRTNNEDIEPVVAISMSLDLIQPPASFGNPEKVRLVLEIVEIQTGS
jgi:hypothetical protein